MAAPAAPAESWFALCSSPLTRAQRLVQLASARPARAGARPRAQALWPNRLAAGPAVSSRAARFVPSRLVKRSAPRPAVARPLDGPHAEAMVLGVAARAARNHHVIADLQRLAADALLGQLSGGAPFDRPANHLA